MLRVNPSAWMQNDWQFSIVFWCFVISFQKIVLQLFDVFSLRNVQSTFWPLPSPSHLTHFLNMLNPIVKGVRSVDEKFILILKITLCIMYIRQLLLNKKYLNISKYKILQYLEIRNTWIFRSVKYLNILKYKILQYLEVKNT